MSKNTMLKSIKLLQFLKPLKSAEIKPLSGKEAGTVLLMAKDGARQLTTAKILDDLHQATLIDLEQQACRISSTGKKHLARAVGTGDPNDPGGFGAQHRKLQSQTQTIDSSTHTVTVNLNESPLARLMSIKSKSGKPWLEPEAFNSAERLRADFTKGQFMQRVTASWDPTARSQSSSKGAGGMADMSDLAIDARARVERALETVGPELSGVLMDVCCFLKGLQAVERERNWPPRSAKLMLRVALGLLARHYGIYSGKAPQA